MGIPSFFRWLAERYPLICESQIGSASDKVDTFKLLRSTEANNETYDGLYNGFVAPEGFDNLYLDVNGIIHNCSHSDANLCQNIHSEEDIFVSIFHCITNIVNIVRPNKLLYLAVDGVAPTAKINQQRERRFRASAEMENQILVMNSIDIQNGVEEKPNTDEYKFDPLQITPGTPFMERLTLHLQFFAQKMIAENKSWKNLQVVVSGSDVPGEGEHKIMEYIRNDKARRHFEANNSSEDVKECKYTSHCIYGLDADLIILSLITHEPFVCLLRERVMFGQMKNSTKMRMMINMSNYVLLHIGILREYILNDLIENPKLRKDVKIMDRVVDDFVLITLFVGNDFLPHLLLANIPEGGLDAVLGIYKGYITESIKSKPLDSIWLTCDCGEINFDNFLSFITRWAKYETNCIQNKLLAEPAKKNGKVEKSTITVVNNANLKIETDLTEMNTRFPDEPKTVNEWKSRYYFAKLGISDQIGDGTLFKSVSTLVSGYFVGIQWILYYYYRSVPSWSWSLSFKYPPFVHDMLLFLKNARVEYIRKQRHNMSMYSTLSQVMDMKFDISSPITPLEQLMMILPPKASYLLPDVLGKIMNDPKSPLSRYYLTKIEVDMDNTNVKWGGIALLPAVPHGPLLEIMNRNILDERTYPNFENLVNDGILHYMESPYLTEDEKERNKFGLARIYSYNANSSKKLVSSLKFFDDLDSCNVECKPFFNPALKKGHTFPNKLLLTGDEYKVSQIPKNLWFPSLSILPYTTVYKRGVDVFNYKSRHPSLYLTVFQQLNAEGVKNLQSAIRSNIVAVGYPYKHFGKLKSILTPYVKFSESKLTMTNLNELKEIISETEAIFGKTGLIVGLKKEHGPAKSNNSTIYQQNSHLLFKIFQNIPGTSITPNLKSVKLANMMNLDHICENVVVSYSPLDKHMREMKEIKYTLLPLVTFIDHVESSALKLLLEPQSDAGTKMHNTTINQVKQMIALREAIRSHELLHGKYSKPTIKAVCLMEGSMYGRVGIIDTVGQTFDTIAAIFDIPDYKTTIAESAVIEFKQFLVIQQEISDSAHEWTTFDEICALANISTTVANVIFQSLTVGKYKQDIGMNLVSWDYDEKCPLSLPGYTRISDSMDNEIDLVRMVLYSKQCVRLVEEYYNRFPELFSFLEVVELNDKRHIVLNQVYPDLNEEQLEFKLRSIEKFGESQPFKRLKLVKGRYSCLSEDRVEKICEMYDDAQKDKNLCKEYCKFVRVQHLRNLHIPAYNTQIPNQDPADLFLGQSVVYINHNETIPLGTKGTIVGVYTEDNNRSNTIIEVILESPIVSATDLFGRCRKMRGVFVNPSDILTLYPRHVYNTEVYTSINSHYDRNNAGFVTYV
ncbi:5'-3' exoribonuclease 2, putative [Theileria equi strain WA]|uniref:5'-3' exoribonuclease 2, putative n=1 Tax=Theileria equi strain WA TaxID=1537102 RepID=L0AVJ1_THEEQ|nr:5'-3' exoribonuclease 2, putative [Theileria equi strain WA]AFZ79041.1 5'-3' exoribonuclease 2, putative [Theileria equi strain WA]|eukprot:XP_004828707.1 5'-3' exoribonuclease 2, putative [Theileria equi strain WA]